MRSHQLVRQILLGNPVVGEIMGVEISLAALLGEGIGMDVLQMSGERACLSLLNVGNGSIQGDVAGIGLRILASGIPSIRAMSTQDLTMGMIMG